MPDGLPMPRRLAAIAAISFGTALLVIDGSIPSVALPSIARDLEVERSAAVAVVTVYQLTLVMTLLPFSTLGDRLGHRRLYQSGQLLFAAASALCLFVESLPFLLIVRAAQAIGAAAALSVSAALLRAIYPRAQLGRGLGINSVVVSSAAALSPTLGGAILAFAPWPWVFAAAVPLALVSLLLGRALPEPQPRAEPFDLAGALLCALTFGLVVGGIETAVHGDSPVISGAIVVLGLYVGVQFVRRERGERRPILPVDLLGRPLLGISVLASFMAFLSMMSLTLSLPFRLEHAYGMSPTEVGAAISPMPLTMMVVAPISGALSDRYPAGILGAIGMGIAAAAFLLIAWLPADPGYFDIAWRLAMVGFGFGMFLSPNMRLILGNTPPERTAAAGGLTSTTRLLGQTLGATLLAAILALGLGLGPVPPLIAAGLALVAGACSLVRMLPGYRSG